MFLMLPTVTIYNLSSINLFFLHLENENISQALFNHEAKLQPVQWGRKKVCIFLTHKYVLSTSLRGIKEGIDKLTI